jgi:gas vesicle protein
MKSAALVSCLALALLLAAPSSGAQTREKAAREVAVRRSL